jgi:hypothetical protein
VTLKETGGPRGLVSPSNEEELSPAKRNLAQVGKAGRSFADVFREEHPGLPPDRADQLEINLEPGTQPVSKPAYRLSPAEMDELKSQLAGLLEKGLIRPSTSPWGARCCSPQVRRRPAHVPRLPVS